MSNRLDSIVGKLSERGLSTREISGAFKRRFSITVSFKNGRANLDKENTIKFAKNESEIGRHFEAFLKTKGKHAGYCRREVEKKATQEPTPPQSLTIRLLRSCGKLLLGMALAVLLGLFWILKNHLGKLCTLLFIGSGVLTFYYVCEREAEWETRAKYNELANNWLLVMIATGAILFIRFIINWLIDPVFCPSAAKGLYMGQSLNNQREIKESLSDIRDDLDT